MTLPIKGLLAAASVLAGTSAQALTYSETFDFFTTASNGAWVSMLSQTQGDLTVKVTGSQADRYENFIPGSSVTVQQWKNHGLGANRPGSDQHLVDSGSSGSDVVFFEFFYEGSVIEAMIDQIRFSYVKEEWSDTYDKVDLYDAGTHLSTQDLADSSYATLTAGLGFETSKLGVGAAAFKKNGNWKYSDFKIKSLTVTYTLPEVPLPAGGLLLAGALGGLALVRRRRR